MLTAVPCGVKMRNGGTQKMTLPLRIAQYRRGIAQIRTRTLETWIIRIAYAVAAGTILLWWWKS